MDIPLSSMPLGNVRTPTADNRLITVRQASLALRLSTKEIGLPFISRFARNRDQEVLTQPQDVSESRISTGELDGLNRFRSNPDGPECSARTSAQVMIFYRASIMTDRLSCTHVR